MTSGSPHLAQTVWAGIVGASDAAVLSVSTGEFNSTDDDESPRVASRRVATTVDRAFRDQTRGRAVLVKIHQLDRSSLKSSIVHSPVLLRPHSYLCFGSSAGARRWALPDPSTQSRARARARGNQLAAASIAFAWYRPVPQPRPLGARQGQAKGNRVGAGRRTWFRQRACSSSNPTIASPSCCASAHHAPPHRTDQGALGGP